MEKDKKNNQLLYTTTDKALLLPSLRGWQMHDKIIYDTYKDGIGKMVFKEEITSIPENLFHNCANLKAIEIPPSCRVIHEHAFYGCINLEKVVFNDGLRAILEYAFAHTRLKEVEIPSSCFIVASYAFAETPLKRVRLSKPSAAYRYVGDYVFGDGCRIEGLSIYDDFCITSLGFENDEL